MVAAQHRKRFTVSLEREDYEALHAIADSHRPPSQAAVRCKRCNKEFPRAACYKAIVVPFG